MTACSTVVFEPIGVQADVLSRELVGHYLADRIHEKLARSKPGVKAFVAKELPGANRRRRTRSEGSTLSRRPDLDEMPVSLYGISSGASRLAGRGAAAVGRGIRSYCRILQLGKAVFSCSRPAGLIPVPPSDRTSR